MSTEVEFTADRFEGVQVDLSQQQIPLDSALKQLKGYIDVWTRHGKRGLWLYLRTDQSALIPQLVDIGFDFHHAKPGYLCLTHWLQSHIPNHLPAYANHYLGVAGFVVNDNNQVLAIQEKYHVKNGLTLWKLPGGLADPGEELADTAKREVFEETGIPSEFVCLLAFRHMHNYRHGCSDFYHVCLMKPLSLEIKPCPNEIAACEWMDLDEYEKLTTSEINKYFVKKYREYMATGLAIQAVPVLSYDRKSMNSIYSAGQIVTQNHHTESSNPSNSKDIQGKS